MDWEKLETQRRGGAKERREEVYMNTPAKPSAESQPTNPFP